MKLKSLLSALILLPLTLFAEGIDFDKTFSDSTLRLDYTFCGNSRQQMVGLKNKMLTSQWAGRRHNLDTVPVQGNGVLTMTDKVQNRVIYKTSFSSLFQEWLTTEEAAVSTISMEHTILVPMPKSEVTIEIKLFDNKNGVMACTTHPIDPKDVLIVHLDSMKVTPHKYLHYSGDPNEKIDVAILGEGYRKEDVDSFYSHAEKTVASILSHEPFKSMADRFNFVAVASESEDSGVSSPSEESWKSTCFKSHYDTFYAKRYLTTAFTSLIHDELIGIPYEHIIILANTDQYGGGGIYNSYTLTTAMHKNFFYVAPHEFGHSFGALADEYWYDDGDVLDATYDLSVEPWEQNITTLVDFDSKWSDIISEDTPTPTPATEENEGIVGLYEGGGYRAHGIYRPINHCRMRDYKSDSFCPVCQRAIARMIKFYTEKEAK